MTQINLLKKILLFGLVILILNCCTESKYKFIYENGESSVQIKFLNASDFLIYDTPIRADFEWKNIDPKTGSIYGAGIKILETKNGITKTEINVPNNFLESDTLNVKLRFEINGEKTGTEFNIPIKNED